MTVCCNSAVATSFAYWRWPWRITPSKSMSLRQTMSIDMKMIYRGQLDWVKVPCHWSMTPAHWPHGSACGVWQTPATCASVSWPSLAVQHTFTGTWVWQQQKRESTQWRCETIKEQRRGTPVTFLNGFSTFSFASLNGKTSRELETPSIARYTPKGH